MTMWVDDADLLAPIGEGEEWTPDQGYPDSSMSVRIWVDADKRLTKVRISNRWRDRAKGTSLSNMFDEAFVLANASIGSSFPQPSAVEEAPETDEWLSWESWDAIAEGIDAVMREQAALDAAPESEVPSRWVGNPVEGHSANQMVAVRLSLHGHLDKIAFGEEWLKQARVSEVCAAVMEAQAEALARFVPPVYEPGDRERLADKYATLERRSAALMRRGPMAQGGSR